LHTDEIVLTSHFFSVGGAVMRQFWLISSFVLLMTSVGLPQESDNPDTLSGWDITSDISLTLTQSSYNTNWTDAEADAAGSISWSGLALTTANTTLNDKLMWKNRLKLAFGQTHTQRTDAERVTDQGKTLNRWKSPSTSTDEIDYESALHLTMGWFVDPYVSGRWQTQFTNLQNEMFDPQTFTEATGLARKFLDQKHATLAARLGIAFRQTVIKDEDTTNDGGIQFIMDYHRITWDNRLDYKSRLEAYQALFYSESDQEGVNDDWKTIDLNWQNTFSFSLIKYISLNIDTQLLYDKQIHDGGRFKEVLSLGFTYKLM